MAGVDIWLVVGARRWARIIAEELCATLPPGASVQLQAPRDDADLQAWWRASPYMRQIEIVEVPRSCCYPTIGVALVANSAYAHPSAIEAAFAAGYHVASEKPIALSRRETQRLLDTAAGARLKLFATNTYLFADYLRVFRREWLAGKPYSDIQLTWSDPVAETRYGHTKSYDSSIPIIHDVLPHIACIILATHGAITPGASEIIVKCGGREVTVRYECGEITVSATLSRNSQQRVRRARFFGADIELAVDFSVEPGVVIIGEARAQSVDPHWHLKRRPLAEMLYSLQVYFGGGMMDDRLDPLAALLGNDMTDSVADSYVRQQIAFLGKGVGDRNREASADFAYASREAEAVARRALPYLANDSPLKKFAHQPPPAEAG